MPAVRAGEIVAKRLAGATLLYAARTATDRRYCMASVGAI